MRLWRLLHSTRLTLFLLIFLALYIGAAAWLPWWRGKDIPPHLWAFRLGLSRPFASIPFLAVVILFFLNTLACTWERTKKLRALTQGRLPPSVLRLSSTSDADLETFLSKQGFKNRGALYFRFRGALWSGWVLHVGILTLLVGVVVQQAFHDGGAFEIAEGERVRLEEPGIVFGREHGPLAPTNPPAIAISIINFDPFLHQPGYAPDRASRLQLSDPKTGSREVFLDRAAGVEAGSVMIYQAIPAGLALNIDVPGWGPRSLHLRTQKEKTAEREVMDPLGHPARFSLEAERSLNDPMGTGPLKIWLEQEGRRIPLTVGGSFPFGSGEAKLLSVTRWGGFTYSHSPGIPAVFLGFFLLLGGSALLLFPAGVAKIETEAGGGTAAWIYVARGSKALEEEWNLNF